LYCKWYPIIIDEETRIHDIPIECLSCKHNTDIGVCKAFEYIPDDIWYGKVLHRTQYPGDNGIQFEPIEE